MIYTHTRGLWIQQIFRRCLALLLLIPVIATAAAPLPVEFGFSMRYLANNSDPGMGASWTAEVFDDATWSAGSYGVGYETHTTGDQANDLFQTTVSSNTQSVYTRASFNVVDVSNVNNMFLGLDYDDGVIVWINGVEIYRSAEMPVGSPDWNTLPTLQHESSNGAIPDYTPLQDISVAAIPLLHNGTNVLAIGVWNTTLPSSDLVLVPWLSTNEPSTLVERGPYLQSGSPTSVVVKWRTSTATGSRVEFGTEQGSLTDFVEDATSTTEHAVTLAGLTPDTMYYYSVGMPSEVLAGDDVDHFFVTSPTPGASKPTRIWILGDSGSANIDAQNVASAYINYTGATHTDLWLMLGDNAYDDGNDSLYQSAVFDMYPSMLRKSVLWSTLGNHDGYSADSASQTGVYYDIFTFPTGGEVGGLASGTEAYYSFNYGNIHFINLDSHDSDRSVDGAMLSWLEQDIAQTSQEWIIAFWHHPPYSKGSHDSDTETQLIEMRENALSILENHGVDLVLTGHSHSYERSFLIDGHYGVSSEFSTSLHLVDGGDGSPTGDGVYSKSDSIGAANQGTVYAVAGSSGKITGGDLNHPVMYSSLNELGSMILDVDVNQLNATFLNSNGEIRDSFTISKGPDITSPAITSVFAADTNTINVNYSEQVSLSTAENISNYSIDGGIAINTATLDANGSTVLFGVSTLTPGVTYTLTINNVQDLAGNSIAAESNQLFSYELTHAIDSRIRSGNDDVEEALTNGVVYFGSSDIELGDDLTGYGAQTVGLRFQSINIPQGATIDAAYLEFVVDETGSTATNVEIRAQATDNAPAFADINRDVTSRALTSATAAWNIPAWDRVGDIKQSPDLSAAVQEVVGRTGWSANNDMVFVISGSGKRTAEAYEGISSAAPLLHVEYSSGTAPPANIAPTAGFSVSTTDLTADFTDVSTDSDGTVGSWAWDFGDGGTATLQSPSHTYAVAGDYTVTLTVTDDDAATDAASKLVTVSEQPENSIVTDTRISSGNDDVEEALTYGNVIFSSSDIELGDDPTGHGTQTVGLRFQSINIPQGATIDAAYLEFVVDETGSTATNVEIRAQATDNAPAFADINRDVTSRALTSATAAWDIPAWDRVGDIKQSPDLSAAVQEVVDRTGWSANNDIVFVISGSGKRTAEAYEGISSAAPLLHVEYSSGTAPSANIAPTAGFSVSTTDLTAVFTDASADSDGTVESWAWDFGDGDTATLQNPSHTYAVAGDYTVTLTVTDDDAATDVASQSVTVTAPPPANIAPTAGFSVSTTDLTADFTDVSTDSDGTVESWAWDFGDGDTATLQNPSHTYAAAGDYTVTLTVTDDDAATDAASQSVTVAPPPPANIAPTAGFSVSTTDLTADFTDVSTDSDGTVGSWAWDFGDGGTATLQNPSHTYAVAGDYTVTLTVTDDDAATDVASQSVTVTAPPPANIAPTAGFSVSTTDLTADFTDVSTDSDGTVESWAWDFGDGDTATLQNPSHTYAAAGDYTVTLTVTDDDAATDVASKLVTVSEQPENSIVIDTRINSGNDDVEEALTNGSVYFGSSDIELGDDLTGYGTQTVGLRFQSINIPQGATIDAAYLEFVVDETGSTATNVEIRAQATDNAPAFADINRDVTSRALTSATAAWDIPAWDRVGDIKQSPDLSAAVQEVVGRTGWSANNDMVFVISGSGKRTAEAYEGISSAAPLLHVEYSSGTVPPANIAPTAGFSVSTTDLTADFTDVSTDSDGTVGSWAWDFGDGGTATLQNPSHTYAVAGDYTVTLTVTDDDAATDVASKLVTVSEQSENSIVIDTRINSGNDDVEEALTSGAIYFGSSDIELGDDLTGYGTQTVGLRFQSINIPQGATIDAAYLEFVVDETGSTATNVEIRAQATDNAPAFADINRDVTSRALTSATAAWDIPAWDRVGDIKQSPDLSAAVQEVVNRTGWSANNDIVFVISGSGKRTAEAYEGISSAAPLLHVEYSSGTAPPANIAPTAGF